MAADQTAKTGDENVQLLLEVTYENYRVTRIRDVSENAEAFFTKRYSDEYIRQQMKRHRDWL
jgi:hypothetical protein